MHCSVLWPHGHIERLVGKPLRHDKTDCGPQFAFPNMVVCPRTQPAIRRRFFVHTVQHERLGSYLDCGAGNEHCSILGCWFH